MTELKEARLLGRAIKSRWDIPNEAKQDAIETLHRIATEGREESAKIAACRALIAAEGQNQKDELSEANELLGRILEIAADLDIDVTLGGAIEGKTSSPAKRVDGKQGKKRT